MGSASPERAGLGGTPPGDPAVFPSVLKEAGGVQSQPLHLCLCAFVELGSVWTQRRARWWPPGLASRGRQMVHTTSRQLRRGHPVGRAPRSGSLPGLSQVTAPRPQALALNPLPSLEPSLALPVSTRAPVLRTASGSDPVPSLLEVLLQNTPRHPPGLSAGPSAESPCTHQRHSRRATASRLAAGSTPAVPLRMEPHPPLLPANITPGP